MISILVGKICIFIGKLLHKGGGVMPGHMALKIDKNLLKKLRFPKLIIAVTGSSGKGSTASLIAKIFKDQGYKVTFNDKDSNLTNGITTAILQDTTITGIVKSDVLVMEIDERYTKYIFKYIKPSIVAVTNITRDQPPRQGNFDLVSNDIIQSITKDMTLIINGDDPYLRRFDTDNTIYYGIDKNKYSYKTNKFMNLNINYCPMCNSKLEYNYYTFENNGDYYCPNCDFKKPYINYSISDIDYNTNKIIINNRYKLNIPFNILFCAYNTLAAFAVSQVCKLNTESSINTIDNIAKNNKLYNQYNFEDRSVITLNNKNENNSSFNQSLLYVDRHKELKTIVIGWKEISRRYKYNDLSWLYDIDFELLKKGNINKIICVGINKYDIATRIKLAGINKKQIKTFDNLESATNYIKTKTKGNIYAILNFDYVKPFNELMKGGTNNDN